MNDSNLTNLVSLLHRRLLVYMTVLSNIVDMDGFDGEESREIALSEMDLLKESIIELAEMIRLIMLDEEGEAYLTTEVLSVDVSKADNWLMADMASEEYEYFIENKVIAEDLLDVIIDLDNIRISKTPTGAMLTIYDVAVDIVYVDGADMSDVKYDGVMDADAYLEFINDELHKFDDEEDNPDNDYDEDELHKFNEEDDEEEEDDF